MVEPLKAMPSPLVNILSECDEAILFLDESGKVQDGNPACIALAPSIRTATGTSISKLIHPDDFPEFGRILARKESRAELDSRILFAPRIWRPVHFTLFSAGDSNGFVVRLQDPVRERSSREALREFTHLKLALDESFPLSIADSHGLIVYVNDLFCRTCGYERNELLGKNHRILNSGSHDAAFFHAMWSAIKAGRTWRGEVCNRHRSGSLFWQDTVIHPLKDEDGNWSRFISIRIPIDERKHVEEELRRARDEAEEANKAKSQFLSVMSHEIRTPLNAVIGLSHLLQRGRPRPDQELNIQVLKTSAENLLHLVNDVLDFSKIDAGRLELEVIPFHSRTLLTDIHLALAPQALEKNIGFDLVIDPQLPVSLSGDPVRIGQILTNLISNAVKFTEQGSVTIRADVLENRSQSSLIKFSVQDTGIGIPSDQLNLIFDAFTQAQSSTTRRFGGTGLGLSITRNLLELMGSAPKVVSQSGEGSTFSFELELKISSAEPETSTASEPVKDLEGMRVLLVEDNEFNVLVAGQFLSEWGVTWDAAANGALAVEAARHSSWDLILMDLQMPVMDGYEATSRIREFDPSIPILALTASAQVDRKDKAFQYGMTDYVTKPINPSDLHRKLRSFAPASDT
jgi:PAS domain S-box-containing protein